MRVGLHRWLVILSAAWVFGCASAHRSPAAEGPTAEPGIELDHIDPATGTLSFKAPDGMTAPKPIQVDLHELSLIGTLRPAAKLDAKDPTTFPYFLFSGRPCENCIQDKALYVLRPLPGKPSTFVYPGKIFEPKSRALVLESRAFYGRCLNGKGDVFVVFQRERIDRRRGMGSSVLVAEPGSDHLDERLIEAHLPGITSTLRAVHAKTCHEIEGRNRVMVSRPSMLLPSNKGHPEVDADTDDEDEDNGKGGDSAPDGSSATPSAAPSATPSPVH